MLTVVLALAAVGLVVLVAAILTGNTILALTVVAVAAAGLLLLAGDWFNERRRRDLTGAAESDAGPTPHSQPPEPHVERAKPALQPEQFEPDVSYDDVTDDAGEDAEHRGSSDDRRGS